jgi:hypothetical protein
MADIDVPSGFNRLLGRRNKTLGDREAVARVNPRSNLLWIVLDRALLYIAHASHWSHSRREEELVALETRDEATKEQEKDDRSLTPTRRLTDEDRKAIGKLAAALAKRHTGGTASDELYARSRAVLRESVEEIVRE